MDEEQPTFKVVDRRPFNPDGTPRELSPEEKEESERTAKAAAVESAAAQASAAEPAPSEAPQRPESQRPQASARPPRQPSRGGDPLDDPASFLSLIMSLA